jgi:glucose-6-phosphate isomerase
VEVAKFGIDTANMFEFWDWVGGRYSMNSVIGLSTMIVTGPENFRAMIDGFHRMDEHFHTAPFERNLPVRMGLLGLWYNNFFGAQTTAVRAEGTPARLVPHRTFEGNRPSSTILLERLTPVAIGKLVALYEQGVFTQGAIWNIDSFDQWGVEQGKLPAARIVPELETGAKRQLKHDSSTSTLIRRYGRSKELSHGR